MKLYIMVAAILVMASCKKFEAPSLAMTPINVGTESYESLEENSILSIPITYTSSLDSGIATASFQVVNNRASNVTLVPSPPIPISFRGKTVDTTIKVPVRTGLLSVVIVVYDKDGKMSSKSVDIKKVVSSATTVKTLTNVVMSTDPADNQNFFSLYEANPVFGATEALTKQSRVDLLLVNMSGARMISPYAYGADANFYNASKTALAGFTTLTYAFLSSNRAFVNSTNFDRIKTEDDLAKFLNDTVIAITPKGGANYNLISADRRVSDSYGVSAATRGFIMGWGYRSHPTATAVILNESFALFLVKSVTQKPNGHFVATFDVKGPAADQRASYNVSTMAPYTPYPL